MNISVNQNEPTADDKKEALQEEEETAKEIRYNDNSSLLRLDDDGYLYYMDYTKDYYSPEVIDALRKLGFVDSGCSSFFTHNTEGEPITCRNYDYPHRVSKEDRTITGLNFVLHCKPEGKYESISLADAVWCDEENPLLQRGGPEKDGFSIDMLDILPYQCMDGINEKGLCVTILRVDIKDGDQPGRLAGLPFLCFRCGRSQRCYRKSKQCYQCSRIGCLHQFLSGQ